MKFLIRLAVVTAIAVGVIGLTPDFIRYMKIRAM